MLSIGDGDTIRVGQAGRAVSDCYRRSVAEVISEINIGLAMTETGHLTGKTTDRGQPFSGWAHAEVDESFLDDLHRVIKDSPLP